MISSIPLADWPCLATGRRRKLPPAIAFQGVSTVHAFVDESERPARYLMCAVVVAPRDLAEVRRRLNALCLPGQRRLRLTKERPPRRRLILARLAALSLQCRFYQSDRHPVQARQACLRAMIRDLAELPVRRLVIEPVESQIAQDRGSLIEMLRDDVAGDMAYEHVLAKHEPILWAADAAAWAYGRGTQWRRCVDGIIAAVIDA